MLIIATDIHGLQPALRDFLTPLGPAHWLSPWPGEGRPYDSEQAAVAAFHARQGLRAYAGQIAQRMAGRPAFIVGFSVGASSAWQAIASAACHPHSQAVLYYGSRIRDALHLRPQCPAHLVWAEHEHAFQPDTIFPALAAAGADCTLLPGARHGFMNPQSPHFQPAQAKAQLLDLQHALERWRALFEARMDTRTKPDTATRGKQ